MFPRVPAFSGAVLDPSSAFESLRGYPDLTPQIRMFPGFLPSAEAPSGPRPCKNPTSADAREDRGRSNGLQILVEQVRVDIQGHRCRRVAEHPCTALWFAPELAAVWRNVTGGNSAPSPSFPRWIQREAVLPLRSWALGLGPACPVADL